MSFFIVFTGCGRESERRAQAGIIPTDTTYWLAKGVGAIRIEIDHGGFQELIDTKLAAQVIYVMLPTRAWRSRRNGQFG